jgi:hypothetical protein
VEKTYLNDQLQVRRNLVKAFQQMINTYSQIKNEGEEVDAERLRKIESLIIENKRRILEIEQLLKA